MCSRRAAHTVAGLSIYHLGRRRRPRHRRHHRHRFRQCRPRPLAMRGPRRCDGCSCRCLGPYRRTTATWVVALWALLAAWPHREPQRARPPRAAPPRAESPRAASPRAASAAECTLHRRLPVERMSVPGPVGRKCHTWMPPPWQCYACLWTGGTPRSVSGTARSPARDWLHPGGAAYA